MIQGIRFAEHYFDGIKEGLLCTCATDSGGKSIDINQAIDQWVNMSENKRKQKGIFFFCGNGASATMAEHMSHDCFQNADFLTETCSETSHITAIANDFSYEDVFAYRIGKMLKDTDMLITISASGNSPNIIKAINTAKKVNAEIITLSGMSKDNDSRKLGDLNFYVPLETYGMVEVAHAVLLHCWLDCYLDKYKGGRH